MIHYILFVLLFFGTVWGQDNRQVLVQEFRDTKIIRKTPVVFRTFPVYIDIQQFRLFIPVEIQYDFLQFVFNNNQYQAGAEIEVILRSAAHNSLRSQIWKTHVTTGAFDSTNRSDVFHFSMDSLQVQAGKYELIFKYRDLNSGRSLTRKFNVNLDFANNARYLSPPLFLYPGKKAPPRFSKFRFQPSAFREDWDFNRDLNLFLDYWLADSLVLQSVRVEIQPQTEIPVMILDSLAELRNPVIRLPAHRLKEGSYKIQLTYYTQSDSLVQNVPLKITWFDKPHSLNNSELAFGIMEYILNKEEFSSFKKMGRKEKQKFFEQYWEKIDPTPETPFNELQAEFYSRVDSANIRWSKKGAPGWTTDLGKIYILYGSPDRIEDHSLDPIANPYLKWIYIRDEEQLEFTFRAVDGRKAYELTHTETLPLDE